MIESVHRYLHISQINKYCILDVKYTGDRIFILIHHTVTAMTMPFCYCAKAVLFSQQANIPDCVFLIHLIMQALLVLMRLPRSKRSSGTIAWVT